ncbi:MAG: ATP-binding protein [Candidatus Hodarchaeales archaeon]
MTIFYLVINNCRGVSDEWKKTTFETFTKKDQSKGIGLSIIKIIMNYLKGEIWITNQTDSPDDFTSGTVVHLCFSK